MPPSIFHSQYHTRIHHKMSSGTSNNGSGITLKPCILNTSSSNNNMVASNSVSDSPVADPGSAFKVSDLCKLEKVEYRKTISTIYQSLLNSSYIHMYVYVQYVHNCTDIQVKYFDLCRFGRSWHFLRTRNSFPNKC